MTLNRNEEAKRSKAKHVVETVSGSHGLSSVVSVLWRTVSTGGQGLAGLSGLHLRYHEWVTACDDVKRVVQPRPFGLGQVETALPEPKGVSTV